MGDKTINTLVADIYNVLDADTDHEVSEDNVQWAGELVKEILRSRFKKRSDIRGEAVLRFSSLGKPDRQLWYAANMPETAEKLHPKQYFKFIFGDMIEMLLLFLAKESGHEVTHLQHGVECDGVRGSMDAVVDGTPVDCKSASPYSFKKFENDSFKFDDPFGYVKQLSGYAHAVDNTERAAFLVADKVGGDIAVAEMDGRDIKANPPGPRIKHLREVVNDGSPPGRCYEDEPEGKSGNRKLGVSCSYCPFKWECWKDSNGGEGLRKYFYSRGPVFLTNVVKEPRVEAA